MSDIKKDPRRRVFRTRKDAKAGLELTDSSAKLMGDNKNFIVVTEQGIFIKGKLSLITDGTGIRRGGLFVQMPDFTRMIPSNIITLNPAQIPSPPISGLQDIQRDLAFFLSFMA
jgi:hypothetical protein